MAFLFCASGNVHSQAQMSIPANFAVSAGGGATYSVTIQVPPGTAGMQPALGISYSSNGGNSLLGMGWSINGLSAITRCSTSFAQDGFRSGVNLDSNDRYCLDGARLMAVTASAYNAVGQEYRTELEGFARVFAIGPAYGSAPSGFTVETKSGQKSYYVPIVSPGQATPFMWVVSVVTDKLNNCMAFSYGRGVAGDELYPTMIAYSGRFAAGTCNSTYNRVEFILDSVARTDTDQMYVAGGASSQKQRIKTIRTVSPMPAGVTATWVKEYRLDYGTGYSAATSRTRLQSIEECEGATGTCLPKTNFAWQEAASTFSPSSEIQSANPIDWDLYGLRFPLNTLR